MTPASPPPSVVFAAEFVAALAAQGVTDAVLSPGSRSTPLALALHAAPGVRLHVRFDERSAGFLALGLAKVSRRPVAVVCTSGTAAANLHPAVLEADAARVGLLVLTADRPPELRGTGANQTVDQIGLYGSAVRWFCEVGVPEGRAGEKRYWRSLAARACAGAGGSSGAPGPVHLNIALREPLAGPLPAPAATPGVALQRAVPAADPAAVAALAELVTHTERGLLVLGDVDTDPAPLLDLAAAASWPVIAEPSSGGRRGPLAVSTARLLLAEPAFAAAHRPEVVLRAGSAGLSRSLLALLGGESRQVLIDRDGRWLDPARRIERLVVAEPARAAAQVVEAVRHAGAGRPTSAWASAWMDGERRVRAAVDALLDADDQPSEPRTARDLADDAPAGALLVAASSMPVRDLDLGLRPRSGLRVLANRGASGIDGFVSTAVGAALAHPGPTFALAGDLSLLHDQNGLLLGADPAPDLVMVVVNNDGGGIFSFLEQAGVDGFERLFGTPHGVDLAALAGAARCGHTRIAHAGDLGPAVGAARKAGGIQVVEVRTDRTANVALHRRLQQAAADALHAG